MDKNNHTRFKEFHAAFPPDNERKHLDRETLEKMGGRYPEALIHEYANFGVGSYGKGLFWLIHPDEPIIDENDWPAITVGVPFLRTAFGEVFLLEEESFTWLNIYSGNAYSYAPIIEIAFEYSLLDPDFIKSAKYGNLFDQSFKKHGMLRADECYGFAPIPKLGGDYKLKYVYKAKLIEYLKIVSQL